MTWQVAIPSYRRAATLRDKTLKLLSERGVPARLIAVFVADEAEAAEYWDVLDHDTFGEVVIGAPGLSGARNAIVDHYSPGDHVVEFDDDVTDVLIRLNDKETESLLDLPGFIEAAFDTIDDLGLTLWGAYPIPNPFFMKPRVTTDLRFIIGQMFGMVVSHEPWAHTRCESKDDYERTLRHAQHAGGVLRFNYVAMKTRMYAGGGLQHPGFDRKEANERDVDYLLAEFPRNVRVAKRVGPVGREIRLVK